MTQLTLEEQKEFFEFLSFRSSSEFPGELEKTAGWLVRRMRAAKMEKVRLIRTEGMPLVYGELPSGKPGVPVILIYGHYDVQPASKEDGWVSEPFSPILLDGKIFARGATDCKGGIYASILAAEELSEERDSLPVSLKYLYEGEEESGSPSLRKALLANRDLFACDLILSVDGCGAGTDPVIRCGFKGMCGVNLELTGGKCDLHSGMAGQMVRNPIHVLSGLISSMTGENGKITIDGFYEDVIPLTEKEKEMFAASGGTNQEYCRNYGVGTLFGEEGYTPTERLFARPAMDVNGIWGGYAGTGGKNIIPNRAGCKMGFRLVQEQEPHKILELVSRHILEYIPEGITAKIIPLPDSSKPYVLPLDHPAVHALEKIDRQIYGKEPKFVRSGGTLPLSGLFLELFGKYLVGFGPYSFVENVHGPNEFVTVENLLRIRKWLPLLVAELGKVL